jgi:peptide/nickel transport system permease protein
MLLYVIKRILWFIPTLFVVTLIGFVLLANAPGDPVDALVSSNSGSALRTGSSIEQQKMHWRKQLGLDLPLFYFSVTTQAEPDTLYKIYDDNKLNVYKALLHRSGNHNMVDEYFNAVSQCKQEYENKLLREEQLFPESFNYNRKQFSAISISLNALEKTADTSLQKHHLTVIDNNLYAFCKKSPNVSVPIKEAIKNLEVHTSKYKNYLPKIIWYGNHNQYHHWLFGGSGSKGIIRGDFGISYNKKEPVSTIIKDKIVWSLFFSVLSILLAYAISIPIGVKVAANPQSRFSKFSHYLLFMLYSMPAFFVGVLLLMLFANPDLLPLFPPSGVKPIEGYDTGAGIFEKLAVSFPYIILPLICYTYSSLAFISRLTTTSVQGELNMDYIKTARAKGLPEDKVIWKHALKNSLLPLITVFSSVFPGIVGGSVIIESVFTIPGMGLETIRAITAQDYPVVIAIMTLSAVLTIFSYLLADVLYAWVDPRIRTK